MNNKKTILKKNEEILPTMANSATVMDENLIQSLADMSFMERELIEEYTREQRERAMEGILLSHAASVQTIERIIAELRAEGLPGDLDIEGQLTHALSEILSFDSRLPIIGERQQKFVALVGPRGAGKTTCIAKLASRMQLAFQATVGLITLQNAPTEPLFQRIIESVRVQRVDRRSRCSNLRQQLERGLETFDDCELVLIDTPGFESAEERGFEDLAQAFAPFSEVERILVLPTASQSAVFEAQAQAFKKFEWSRLILTHLDQSVQFGELINSLFTLAPTLAFFSLGQRSPQDLEPATPRRIANLLSQAVH